MAVYDHVLSEALGGVGGGREEGERMQEKEGGDTKHTEER